MTNGEAGWPLYDRRMSPANTRRVTATAPPLTDHDVIDLRAKLDNGDRPRVVVRTASAAVPAGTRGNVIRIGNPADGEFIVVRLGRDEVPFAPTELGLPGKRAVAAAAPPTPSKSTTAATTAKRTASSAPKRGSRSAAKKKAPPPLTVTLRFGQGAWSVEAHRGARRLARASALRPGAVAAFAELVDEPTIREALTETVESCRVVIEERAQQLRSELQAAEATLREYDTRRR